MKINKLIALLCLALVCATTIADENEWFVPLGMPPPASPRRISGGESVAPLPLPATPLRRSERKREPSPPKMAGKVIWGENATFKYDGGITCEISDWNLCPSDLQQILNKTSGQLSVQYGCEAVNLSVFHGNPSKMPVLFISGTRTLRLNDSQLASLHDFVMKGGMIIFDSVAGSPYFYDSVKNIMDKIFPESVFRVVPLDHPIYHMVYDVEEVKYSSQVVSQRPFLEGIYMGARIGILLSKYGLGCGWDDHEVPLLKQAMFYDVKSANKLGVNMMAYAIGYAEAAREEAKPELFGALDEKKPTDEFVFAQIKHNGAWNTHPGSAASLLRRLRQNTSLRTSLKRASVAPGKDDISSYPFLFLSGLDDFDFDAAAVSALRAFLAGGGTLVINNGLGMKTFDQAVRREMKKILPEAKFDPVTMPHPLYNSVFAVGEAQYTPAVMRQDKTARMPYLEGITLNGDLRVIYSPYDIEAGWLECDYPLCKGYMPASAMQLGINIIMYAMTH